MPDWYGRLIQAKGHPMRHDRIRKKTVLTRRALVLAAPALLMQGTLLAALSAMPDANEGPLYPVRLPKD